MNIKKFLDSPHNRTGISIWMGAAVTVIIQRFEFHQILSSVDLFGLILGFLKIVEPENTVTQTQLQKAVSDMKAVFMMPGYESLGAAAPDVVSIAKMIKR